MSDPLEEAEAQLDAETFVSGFNLNDKEREALLDRLRKRREAEAIAAAERAEYRQRLHAKLESDLEQVQAECRRPLPPPPPTTGLSVWRELELRDLRNRIQHNTKTKGKL